MRRGLLLIILFIIITVCLCTASSVQAQIQSPQYKILEPTVGIDDTDNRIQTTLTRSQLTTFQQQGYVIRDSDTTSLRATLSHATLTFENLANQAQNVSTVLTITSTGVKQYQALLQAQHPLKTVWGDEIPTTNCDTGCTINVARPWTKVDSSGFGYTLKGNDIPADFKNISYYRKLADRSRTEEPRKIMYGDFFTDTRQSTIIFRVNSSKDQPDGTYQTIIDIFVVPLN